MYFAFPIFYSYHQGDSSVDDSCMCDANDLDEATVVSDSAISFSTFPWQVRNLLKV